MTLEEFAQDTKTGLKKIKKRFGNMEKKFCLKSEINELIPALEDKSLLSWNALMNSAYCNAYAATGNEHYKNIALRNMDFVLKAFSNDKNELFHSWKNGKAKYPAFLDDYSFS